MEHGRMTKTTIANIKVAQSCGFEQVQGAVGWFFWLKRDGGKTYVCDSRGPIVYLDTSKARRALLRVRKDTEPTNI